MSLLMIHFNGLAVAPVCRAGRSVSGVRHGNAASWQPGESIPGEDLAHKSKVFVRVEETILIDDDAAALLASVLQGIQSVITHHRYISRLLCHHSENTAFFVDLHAFAPH
jgi:hypothetical protein